ncbi:MULTISPECIES: hypothetical protein [Bacteroides]|nr:MULTISPECIES: hypothetical protein [Bacteroides]
MEKSKDNKTGTCSCSSTGVIGTSILSSQLEMLQQKAISPKNK